MQASVIIIEYAGPRSSVSRLPGDGEQRLIGQRKPGAGHRPSFTFGFCEFGHRDQTPPLGKAVAPHKAVELSARVLLTGLGLSEAPVVLLLRESGKPQTILRSLPPAATSPG